MPVKEEPPFREGRGEDQEYTPPISEFSSARNLLQWRMDALAPRLHGPEKDKNASHELMLNGSEHFMQVHGGGGQAAAFHSWVGETFAFVTNVTPYNLGGSENSDVAQSEAADMDASMMNGQVQSAVSGEGDGNTPLMPASMVLPAPRRTESDAALSEQGNLSTAAGEVRSRNLGPESVGISREPLSPATPPPASFPHDGQTGLHAQTGQPAPDMAEQVGGEMGGESALPSPAEHMFTPVTQSLSGRCIRSLPGRRIRSLPGRRIRSLPGRRYTSI